MPAGSEGWQSPLVHSARAYACNHFQYGCASWSELKCYWPFWTHSERKGWDRFVCAFAGMNRQMGYRKNRGIFKCSLSLKDTHAALIHQPCYKGSALNEHLISPALLRIFYILCYLVQWSVRAFEDKRCVHEGAQSHFWLAASKILFVWEAVNILKNHTES